MPLLAMGLRAIEAADQASFWAANNRVDDMLSTVRGLTPSESVGGCMWLGESEQRGSFVALLALLACCKACGALTYTRCAVMLRQKST